MYLIKMDVSFVRIFIVEKEGLIKCMKVHSRMNHLYMDVRKTVNQEIQKDVHRIYRIYIEHDLTIVPELKELAAQQEGGQKAVTLFRIAKLQDQTEALDTLRIALPLSRGTA